MLTIVIGRGHSGTRLMSHTLSASGFHMGQYLNGAGDLIPADYMYTAARLFGGLVTYKGNCEWDLSKVNQSRPTEEFEGLVESYIHQVMDPVLSNAQWLKGWKLPENSLVVPWLVKMFPRAYFIYWIRDPRDVILDAHITDDLRKWNVPCPTLDDELAVRAYSWLYQYNLAHSFIKPKRWLVVRFEDFVLRQQETLERIGDFYHMKMVPIPVNRDKVGVWRTREPDILRDIDFLQPALNTYYGDML